MMVIETIQTSIKINIFITNPSLLDDLSPLHLNDNYSQILI